MNQLHFTKMHGLGNDFVVIDGIHQTFNLTAEDVRTLANRHTGIGFDQLLLVEKSTDPTIDFNYRIFNADGGEVAQCGNGARCLAIFVRDKNLTKKNLIRVATKNNVLELHIENQHDITVNMGTPQWNPEQIPFLAERQATHYRLHTSVGEVVVGAVSMGNPHCVIQVPHCETAPVALMGKTLAQHPHFPDSVNVGFMEIVNPQHIRLRVYERGAGETLACGSGACAAVAIGQLWNLLGEEVRVDLTGGDLHIRSAGIDKPIWLTGPAVSVFDGELS